MNLSKNQAVVGSLFALGATTIWSGTYLVARLAVGEISPLTLGFSRWFLATIILVAITFSKMKKEWPLVKSFLPNLLVGALFGIAAFSPLTYFAAKTSSALNLSLIAITFPIFIVIISACLGTKQATNTWVGSIIALFGSAYLVSNGNLEQFLNMHFAMGDILMLIAATGFSIYCILLKNPPKGLSQLVMLAYMAIFGIIMLFPLVMWEFTQANFIFNLNSTVIFSIIFSALGASIGALFCWNQALAKAGPELAGLIYYTVPLFSGLLGFIFLGESVVAVHFVSGALIVGGILWARPRTVKDTKDSMTK